MVFPLHRNHGVLVPAPCVREVAVQPKNDAALRLDTNHELGTRNRGTGGTLALRRGRRMIWPDGSPARRVNTEIIES